MGGGDDGRPLPGGGDGHGGAGQVGLVGEEVDVLVETALLVVHRHHVVVVGGPLDAVQIGVPAVFLMVDVYILDQAQGLPQIHNGGGICRRRATDLVGVVHGQGIAQVLSIAVLEPQSVAVVDVQGEGVGAGGIAAHVGHGEHHLIGVLQVVAFD